MTSYEDRFWSKVEKTETCWLWRAGLRGVTGYGSFWYRGRTVNSHRFAYELLRGPVPDGLVLDHLCRVRHCVNPDHLEPVTNRENLLRGEGFAARLAARTHCPRGHAYDEANTYLTNAGTRQCKACARLRNALRPSKARPRAEHRRSGPKLSPSQAIAIFEAPGPNAAIAREFDVSDALVSKIRRGLLWASVTGGGRVAEAVLSAAVPTTPPRRSVKVSRTSAKGSE